MRSMRKNMTIFEKRNVPVGEVEALYDAMIVNNSELAKESLERFMEKYSLSMSDTHDLLMGCGVAPVHYGESACLDSFIDSVTKAGGNTDMRIWEGKTLKELCEYLGPNGVRFTHVSCLPKPNADLIEL